MMPSILLIVTLNTAAAQAPDGTIQELCVVAAGTAGAATYVGACSDILSTVNNNIKQDYPGQPFELVLNGKSLNTI